MNVVRFVSCLWIGTALAGCGGGAALGAGGRPYALAPGARCVVSGQWTNGELRAPDGSFAYARVLDAQGAIDLSAAPADARVEIDGFSLRGSIDLTSEIRVVPPTALGQTVLLPPGAHVAVLAVEGERAQIGLGRFAFDDADEVQWIAAPSGWVSCRTGLGLTFAYRDEESERRERLALGLPLDPPTRYIPSGHTIALSGSPGGPVEVTMGSTDYPIAVWLLEEQGGLAHIARQHWTGATLLGWTTSSELLTEEPTDAYGSGGLLGALMNGIVTYEVCHADHALPLSVRRIADHDADGNTRPLATPGAPIVVGSIAAGSRFVRLESRADGTTRIEAHHDGHLSSMDEAEWLVPTETFACAEESYDPASVFAGVTID